MVSEGGGSCSGQRRSEGGRELRFGKGASRLLFRSCTAFGVPNNHYLLHLARPGHSVSRQSAADYELFRS